MHEKSKAAFAQLLSFVNALYYMYYNMHWKSSGPNYYADHLLYERLYEAVEGEIDKVAEKAIGIFDDQNVISPVKDFKLAAEIMEKYISDDHTTKDFPENAIRAEKDFIEAIKEVGKVLAEEEMKTQGVEDLFPSIIGQHEENLYLLQQRARGTKVSESTASTVSELISLADTLDASGAKNKADEIDKIIKDMLEK